MHRQDILNQLESYNPEYPEEKEFRVRFLKFIRNHADCFERSLQIGHLTGSAWIINSSGNRFLLTHHYKLDKWLQLGGHADGETNIRHVAMKEAKEESGLQGIELVSPAIFDIDIHTIPARKNEPEHLHYDIRYLFTADDQETLITNRESNELAWLTAQEIRLKCKGNTSINRMVEKMIR